MTAILLLKIQREQSHQESKATFSHEAFTRSCLGYEFGDSDCMIRSEAKYQLKFRKAGKLASYLCKSERFCCVQAKTLHYFKSQPYRFFSSIINLPDNFTFLKYPYTRPTELRPTRNLTYHLFSVLLPIDRVYILLRIP
ncbi:hypothetical protein T03_1340 [Trichinella britovi]|uniref:Uncharacterized protein n=1 Tax=Trichinella britovi TaxID=45882 RepID=A0A0V1DF40_TRIBR|nr:hypothetical protein T09_686 [Trichinella sp. T9]KRY60190.1 hypothetical protein T03_1340 [Trichinella britovi]